MTQRVFDTPELVVLLVEQLPLAHHSMFARVAHATRAATEAYLYRGLDGVKSRLAYMRMEMSDSTIQQRMRHARDWSHRPPQSHYRCASCLHPVDQVGECGSCAQHDSYARWAKRRLLMELRTVSRLQL